MLSIYATRDTSVRVGPKTTLRAGRQERRSLASKGTIICFSFPREFTSTLGPTRPVAQWAPPSVSLDEKLGMDEAHRSPESVELYLYSVISFCGTLWFLMLLTFLICEYLSIYVLIPLFGCHRVTKMGKLK
jgi:hypothetical protein